MRRASSWSRASSTARSASASADSVSRRRRSSCSAPSKRSSYDAIAAPGGLRLLALDLLRERPFAPADPLVQLVQRPPPLGRVRVQLGVAAPDRLLDRTGELVAQPDEAGALLLALGLESLRVGGDSRLGVGDELTLSRGELFEVAGDGMPHAVEVLVPLAQTRLDLPLRVRERRGEPGRRCTLVLGRRPPALLGDPSFLVGEQRRRLGAGARERPAELLPA